MYVMTELVCVLARGDVEIGMEAFLCLAPAQRGFA